MTAPTLAAFIAENAALQYAEAEAELQAGGMTPSQTLRAFQVLTMVRSVREVIAWHTPTLAGNCPTCATVNNDGGPIPMSYPCPTLTALAAMYAGRDGYEAAGGDSQ